MPGDGGLVPGAAHSIISLSKFLIKKDLIYNILSLSPLFFTLSPSFPFIAVGINLDLSNLASPLLPFQNFARKQKRLPRFYPQKPLSWKNLQLGLLASLLYHNSALIARKKTPAITRKSLFQKRSSALCRTARQTIVTHLYSITVLCKNQALSA